MNNRWVEQARQVSRDVLKSWASEVDRQNRFPSESIAALREMGLLGFWAERSLQANEVDVESLCEIASVLGEACLSTALIWAMHIQQVAVLVDHASETQAEILEKIAREGILVASVTTEGGKGGDLLSAQAPLIPTGDGFLVRRMAPVVSYGAEAGCFLITMRSQAEAPPNDVSLVLVKPSDGTVTVSGDWHPMGMRGTRSVPMSFDVTVGAERVIARGDAFRNLALQTMIPFGHLGWVAAWYGAARGAFRGFVRQLRTAQGRRWNLNSDLFLHRLANLRLSLDLIQSMLQQVIRHVESLRHCQSAIEGYEDVTFTIALNNLKLAGSRLAFSVADDLVELGGLSKGYLENEDLGLARAFRDLRSAALMFSNDRLLEANGKLILIEKTAYPDPESHSATPLRSR